MIQQFYQHRFLLFKVQLGMSKDAKVQLRISKDAKVWLRISKDA